jgi:hypothetical protein
VVDDSGSRKAITTHLRFDVLGKIQYTTSSSGSENDTELPICQTRSASKRKSISLDRAESQIANARREKKES